MSTTTPTGLREIRVVILPVADSDRAIDFYVEKLGFEKRRDTAFGDRYRWVEVYPPSGTTAIALAPPPPDGAVTPTQTGISLVTSDIEATHAELKARGVDVDAEISRMGGPVPPMFWLRDADGHALIVVETD
jgi:catechol 2,3-dioxygenase-like lactoylglutathione lyase family enzyme